MMKKLLLVLTMAVCFGFTYGQNCNPPRDLQGITTKNKVNLTWTAPAQSGDQEVLTWGTGELYTGIGISNTNQFQVAHKFVPTDIADYVGWKVVKISFIPYTNGNFILKTYVTTGSSNPTGNGVVNQTITSVVPEQWNEFTITNPVTIEANKSYWFGYAVSALNTTDYPAGADGGPAITGKGDVVYLGSWSTLTEAGLSYNWCIKTTVQNAKGELKDLYIDGEGRANVASYNVYRDNKLVGSPTETSYTDSGLEMETTYNYCVEAVYDNGCISSQICGDYTTLGLTCTPPQNVAASSILDAVTVTWEAPYVPSENEWLTWSGEISANGVGTGSTANFYCVQRFPVAQMSPFSGYELTKVKFVPNEPAENCTYSIRVWTGSTSMTNPGTLVVNQPVPADVIVANEWVEVTLNTPVAISGDQEVWFGFECQATTGYPGGCDAGPAIDGFGNMMWMGSWSTLLEVSSSLNYNWLVQGFVESGSKSAQLSNSAVADNVITMGNPSDLKAERNSIFKCSRYEKNTRDAVLSYNIYRENTLVGTVDANTTQFTEQGVEDGDYSYCVSAVYDHGCESVTVCAEAEVATSCWPINDLEHSILAKKNIKLSWSEPVDPNAPTTWISWSGEPDGNSIGTGSANDFYCAQRFEAVDLVDYTGMALVAVNYVPCVKGGDGGCTYSIKIWTGGAVADTKINPGTLIVDQVVPADQVVTNVWNTVYLDTPVSIDASQELWIGYECNTTTGHPAGTDAGPCVDYKGNLMFFGGSWTTMYLAGGSSPLDYNWAIQGGLADKKGNTAMLSPIAESTVLPFDGGTLSVVKNEFNNSTRMPAFDHYVVYRNGDMIKDNLKSKSYTDMNVPTGDYVYGVTAVYVNECESEAVETDVISIINDGLGDNEAGVSIYPNPANSSVVVNGINMTNIVVYNSIGQVIDNITVNGNSKTINTLNYKAGMYFIDVNTVEGYVVKTKVVIAH